jgi:hypothetical protein
MNRDGQNPAVCETKGCRAGFGQWQDGAPDRNRTQIDLDISAAIPSDDALNGLLDDWIVPMIVNQIIESLKDAPLESGGL